MEPWRWRRACLEADVSSIWSFAKLSVQFSIASTASLLAQSPVSSQNPLYFHTIPLDCPVRHVKAPLGTQGMLMKKVSSFWVHSHYALLLTNTKTHRLNTSWKPKFNWRCGLFLEAEGHAMRRTVTIFEEITCCGGVTVVGLLSEYRDFSSRIRISTLACISYNKSGT